MKNFETLIDALTDLKKRGYDADFETQTACLYCGDLDLRLYPEEFTVDEVYRFEGGSNPDDNVVLYAIKSSAGVKGTLIEGYSVYSENRAFDITQKLRYKSQIVS